MSATLVAKEIRHRFKAALTAAEITVDPGGGAVPVAMLKTPPAGWVVPDDKLPALYVFASGEALSHEALSEVTRQLFLDVVLMARGSGDPMDQLDDMQLAVEQTMIAAGGFGLARSNRLQSAEIAQSQGALIIGTRVMKFEIIFGVTPDDPSL
ncbi:hypothetical protein SAMN05444149_108101 [Pseudosulfitobacter pseudonitzschiae]|uniref:Uncharacterized protein n=1 Tax=Pseudosulfitobacter pseudonitzschiae TaxID=1402135 RepID=A0A073IW32_9RHOB|nr:hypothetical protein [Pseudosulfitobacter pseudonitzschiae]KEJ93984.1 hypothetical protein SUH3_11985 [Pseudosulfitobacter pseudonitzschiae]SHG01685.1 hypothetical protein SAMN05444149_108101 [Pseudosulfitobacter pseudonitzschiae]